MKKKEKTHIRELAITELNKQIVETEHKLAQTLRDKLSKQGKDLHDVQKMRKKLAVLKTVVREKELAHG